MAMTTIQFTFLATYLLPSSIFLNNWVKFFKQKNNLSPEESFLSFTLLLITTILWPLLIPYHCLEFLKAKMPKRQLGYVMPAIFLVVTVGVLTVSSFAMSKKIIAQGLIHILPDASL